MASGDHRAIRPLAVLFERARAASTAALEGGCSTSDDALDAAIDACSAAESAADAAGASPSPSSSATNAGGETADDLSARDLRWVLLPGWGGLLQSKRASCSASSTSLAAKRAALLEASERLKAFLSTCQELGVAPKEALATLKEAEDDDDGGAGGEDDEEEGGGEGRPPPSLTVGASNPEARRAAKIAAFRAKRALHAKLSELREKAEKKKKQKMKKGGKEEGENGKNGNDNDDDDDDDDDEEEEEELREAVLAEIALTCLSAADEVLAIREEAAMLRHALRREADAEAKRGGGGSGGAGASGRGAAASREEEEERKRREEASAVATALRGAFSALSSGEKERVARSTFAPASVGAVSAPALGGLFGPGTGGIGGMSSSSSAFDRGAAAASVFRPSHLLPTMSLEEFADREVAEARARSEADRARKAAAARKAASSSSADDGGDDGKTEADGGPALDRLRALDDWKDDHPYGYGNSKRRPAATGSK